MIISYEDFKSCLNKKLKSGDDFYTELLTTVISSPSRYCGLFRLSNAKTKLIQNVTQSKEIKFGDFIEEISTEYLAKIGYENKSKEIGHDSNGDRLSADQVFVKGNNIYLVEQKVRDDHDSTKKRGQYENFHKKVLLIREKFPTFHLVASMWFVDDGLVKNRNYYKDEMNKESFENTELHLFYGGEFFHSLIRGDEVWNEIVTYLKQLRMDNSNEVLTIPDFGSSPEILDALIKLPSSYWNKLVSKNEKYDLLRIELFCGGDNLTIAAKRRKTF